MNKNEMFDQDQVTSDVKNTEELVETVDAEEFSQPDMEVDEDTVYTGEVSNLEYDDTTTDGSYDLDIVSTESPRIARFEKVSYNEFVRAYKPIWVEAQRIAQEVPEGESFGYSIEEFERDCKSIYDRIQIPKRSTIGSAGYDFFFPYGKVELPAGASVFIPTGIKVKIASNWVLIEAPRSGMGMKYRIQLDNTIGVVDSDYYNNEENEGHIFIKITNDSRDGSSCVIDEQSRFCQGFFVPYGITVDDNVTDKRAGGLGSTGA